MPIDPDRYYKPAELAALMGMGQRAIAREAKRGTLRASQITKRGYVVSGEAALAYLRERERPQHAHPVPKA